MGLVKKNQRWTAGQFLSVLTLGLLVMTGLFALWPTNTAHAVVTTLPTKMNFQGRVTNASGNILANGTYNMRFKIYNAASGGTLQWSEDRLVSASNGVTVANGQFSVQLGSVSTLPASIFASNSLYFEVELPTPASATTTSPVWTELPMTPRNQLATSAYAYNSETLDGLDSDAFSQIGAANTYTGVNTFNGTSVAVGGVANATKFNVSNLFNVDSSNSIVSVGAVDATGTVLVLDTKNTSGDPTGASATNGAMYYNSNTSKFRCYQAGAWIDCAGSGAGLGTANTFTANNIFRSATNNTTAFQVQNSASQNLFSVDTTNAGTVTVLGNNSGETSAWSTNAVSLPNAKSDGGVVTANGYAYHIGGANTGSVDGVVWYAKLNANGSVGSWTTTTPLPGGVQRTSGSSFVSNGYIYQIGGYDNTTSYFATVFYAKLNADGTVGAWQTSANSFPAPTLSYTSAVVANGYAYVFGGWDGGASKATVYYAKLNADGSNGVWNTTTALPQIRDDTAAVAANGYVYVVGGYGSAIQKTVYYAKLNSDGTLGAWTSSVNQLVEARQSQGLVVSNGYIYNIGGNDASASTNNIQYAKLNADGSTGVWQISANTLPQIRQSFNTFVANGYTYVIGGSDGANSQSTVYYARLGGVLQVGGSIDLVGLQGQTLADGGDSSNGSTGGSITAGNITGVGSLQIQKSAMFADSVSILGDMNVGNGLFSVDDNDGGTVTVLGNNNGELSAWKQTASTTAATRNSTVTIMNGNVYRVGGTTNASAVNSVEYAKLNGDGTTGPWSSTTPLTFVSTGATSATANGYIYNISGSDSATPDASVQYAKVMQNGSLSTWTNSSAPLPAARDGATSVVANGYVYVMGGAIQNGTAQTTVYYAKLNADGSTGAWQTSANALPAGRWGATSVISNGYAYIFGGATTNGGTAQTTVYYAKLNADGSTGAWQTSASTIPAARNNATSVISNGYAYIFGGANGGTPQTTVYYAKLNIDGTVGAWKTSTNSIPQARTGSSSIIANGYAYLINGGTSGEFNTVYSTRLGGALQVGGNLDLVGLQGQNLTDGGDTSTGSTGGSIYAGNITAVGNLQIQKQAFFADSVSVTGDFNAGNGLFDVNTGSSLVGIGVPDAIGVVLVLDTKNTAGDPTGVSAASGAMYFNSNLGRFRCYSTNKWVDCRTQSQGSTATQTIVNTTTETVSTSNYVMDADECQPGRVYKITARGTYSQTAAAVNLTLKVRMGTTVLATSGATAMGTTAYTNQQWKLTADVMCQTNGTSGTVEAGGEWLRHTTATAMTEWSILPATVTSPVTINTTVAQTLQLSVQWSTALSGNTFTIRQFSVQAYDDSN